MPIYSPLSHHLLPTLLTLCHRSIYGMACWRCLENQHRNRSDSHYSHHGTRTQENDERILHFPFEYMVRSARIKTKDNQDTPWKCTKDAQKSLAMPLTKIISVIIVGVYILDHSNIFLLNDFLGLLSETWNSPLNDMWWPPSSKTWSHPLIVFPLHTYLWAWKLI